jgi:hypothetical protein
MPAQHGRLHGSAIAPDQGNCLIGRRSSQGDVMFHGTYDRAARADRYRAVAAEYNRLFKTASDPYLASYYLRIAKDYLVRSQDELRALKREQIIGLAPGADMPSPKLQPNADPLGYV